MEQGSLCSGENLIWLREQIETELIYIIMIIYKQANNIYSKQLLEKSVCSYATGS